MTCPGLKAFGGMVTEACDALTDPSHGCLPMESLLEVHE